MSMTRTRPPLRVGIAGLGRNGLYHLERLSLRSDFTVVAAHDADAPGFDLTQRFGVRFVPSWEAFVADREIDVVIVAAFGTGRKNCVVDTLSKGKHVAVDAPLAFCVADADAMFHAARCAERTLTVIQSHRCDVDFLTALCVERSGDLGEIQSARILVYELGIEPLCRSADDPANVQTGSACGVTSERGDSSSAVSATASATRKHPSLGAASPDREELPCAPLVAFAGRYIEQLCELLPGQADSVFAHFAPEGKALTEEPAFTLFVSYAGGATALIEINFGSLAPLKTGWLLSGTRGAYRNQRRYQITPQGEVFAVPMESPQGSESNSPYDCLQSDVQGTAVVSESAQRGRVVATLIEAAWESAASGQVVLLGSEASEFLEDGRVDVGSP